MTPNALLSPTSWKAEVSSSMCFSDRALRRRGLFIVIVAKSPSYSKVISSYSIAFSPSGRVRWLCLRYSSIGTIHQDEREAQTLGVIKGTCPIAVIWFLVGFPSQLYSSLRGKSLIWRHTSSLSPCSGKCLLIQLGAYGANCALMGGALERGNGRT